MYFRKRSLHWKNMLPRTLSSAYCLLIYCIIFRFGNCSAKLSYVTTSALWKSVSENDNEITCALLINDETQLDVQLARSSIGLGTRREFREVLVGVADTSEENYGKHFQMPKDEELPLLRCFTNAKSFTDYGGSSAKSDVRMWIRDMRERYRQMWRDDLDSVLSSVSDNSVTLVALLSLDHSQHVGEVVTQVADTVSRQDTVSAIYIHPKSSHKISIYQYFNVTMTKSAVVSVVKQKNQVEPAVKVFKESDMDKRKIESFVLSRLVAGKHLSQNNFASETLTVKKTERFRPHIVLFYSWWAAGTKDFLTLFRRAVDEFRSLSMMVKFALVNVSEEKTIISRYINIKDFKSLPFVVAFQKEKGKDSVKQTLLDTDRPSAFYLYKALKSANILMEDPWGNKVEFSPYRSLDYTQFCDLREGPWGSICTSWASNQTDSHRPPKKVSRSFKLKSRKKSVLDLMEKINGIPVMSRDLWDAVMEKSDVAMSSRLGQPAVRITLVVFIRDYCGSCQQKMNVFKELHTELKKTDSSRLYLVNCSRDAILCSDLKVQGYPSVMTFRNYGSLVSPRCDLPLEEKTYAQQDYHGPISTWELLSWHERLSANSIKQVAFTVPELCSDTVNSFTFHICVLDKYGKFIHEADARLVATVIPKLSQYLPVAPKRDRNFFFGESCLRLVCERLFGLASCLMLYSGDVPKSEYSDAPMKEMVVTQISFERRDGVSLKLMTLGKSLSNLLEQETSTNLHLFHHSHHCTVRDGQRCEDDHNACGQILVQFTRDHLRLPVTHLTSEIFHTKNSPLFEDRKPVLIVLATAVNMTASSSFMQMLQEVAMSMYKDLTVTIMDVSQYPSWAGRFVPHKYYNLFADTDSAGPLHVYPRMCLVDWHDHSHAAFYPPLSLLMPRYSDATNASVLEVEDSLMFKDVDGFSTVGADTETQLWKTEFVLQYIAEYLKQPDKFTVKTEHF
ncbi:uncharacterized protein LOC101860854 [Aplysia californica]|uniref:Uncharacterized protein LOC101860854 n=1 Tax=Aplysia californica TaxID=6500 RepID=A0ABM1ABR0_APLCA|nr:uncharacterized protein LOC101860854 [Aplysia californica]